MLQHWLTTVYIPQYFNFHSRVKCTFHLYTWNCYPLQCHLFAFPCSFMYYSKTSSAYYCSKSYLWIIYFCMENNKIFIAILVNKIKVLLSFTRCTSVIGICVNKFNFKQFGDKILVHLAQQTQHYLSQKCICIFRLSWQIGCMYA